jgi:hypothetical protein
LNIAVALETLKRIVEWNQWFDVFTCMGIMPKTMVAQKIPAVMTSFSLNMLIIFPAQFRLTGSAKKIM